MNYILKTLFTDRTMRLLKEGAKTCSLNTSVDEIQLNTSNPFVNCNTVDATTKLKQTFLSNNLKLETTGRESQVKFISKNKKCPLFRNKNPGLLYMHSYICIF